MGISISAKAAREAAYQIRNIKRVQHIERIAETKFKSIFSAIRAKMGHGEMYVPAVGVAGGDINDFKEVMSYYGYTVQCQYDGVPPHDDFVAVFSIWFNK
jgi:hypothetical protein